MKRLLLRILVAGLIVWLYQPSFAEGYWQSLNTQSTNAYNESYHPNFFAPENQNQLDSMVQFRYFGNDSSYQHKIQYQQRTNGGQTVKEEIQYQWQNEWKEKIKNEYTYNSGGELTKSAVYVMDSVTNQWQQIIKNSYAYKNGKKDNNVVQKRDSISNQWKNAYKYEYEYNNSDSATQQVTYCWNDEAKEWEYYYKNEYFYNYLNCQDSSCQYQWDSLANQWARQYKSEYFYNTNDLLVKQYQYRYDSVNCQWDSCVCQLYEYDNDYLHKHEYCIYDTVNNDWDYDWKHEFFYNGDGDIVQSHRYKHSDLKSTASDWELDTKDFYYYANVVTEVASSENLVMQEIRIYPNPASKQITLDLKDIENCRLQIVDITGRMLKQFSISSHRTVIPLTQFEPGAYFFIVDNGLSRKANKVIVQ